MLVFDPPPGFHLDHSLQVANYVPYVDGPYGPVEKLCLRAAGPRLDGLDEVDPDLVFRITCGHVPLSDRALEHLTRLTGLVVLDLTRTKVTDAGLHTLARIPNLRHLTLNGCNITDVGVRAIAVSETLEELELFGTPVTGAGLKPFTRHPTLKVLDLRHTKVRGGLETLATIPHLRELRLSGWAARHAHGLRERRPELKIV